jgi:hypothetical protein
MANNSEISETLGFGYLSFGVDDRPENIVDTFSQISLDYPIQKIINFLRNCAEYNFLKLITQKQCTTRYIKN